MSALDKLIKTDRDMAGYTAAKYREMVEQAAAELAALREAVETARAYVDSRAPGNSVTKFPAFQRMADAIKNLDGLK